MHNYISVEQRMRRLEEAVSFLLKESRTFPDADLIDSLRADVEQHKHQQRIHEDITQSMDATFPRDTAKVSNETD